MNTQFVHDTLLRNSNHLKACRSLLIKLAPHHEDIIQKQDVQYLLNNLESILAPPLLCYVCGCITDLEHPYVNKAGICIECASTMASQPTPDDDLCVFCLDKLCVAPVDNIGEVCVHVAHAHCIRYAVDSAGMNKCPCCRECLRILPIVDDDDDDDHHHADRISVDYPLGSAPRRYVMFDRDGGRLFEEFAYRPIEIASNDRGESLRLHIWNCVIEYLEGIEPYPGDETFMEFNLSYTPTMNDLLLKILPVLLHPANSHAQAIREFNEITGCNVNPRSRSMRNVRNQVRHVLDRYQ